MKQIVLCVIVFHAAVASAGAEPEVYVGRDSSRYVPVEGTVLVGGDDEYQGDLHALVPPTWIGYKCKDFPFGCPSGTAIVIDGDIKGCDFVAGPPAACTGTCTSCASGGGAASLCERDPASSCELQGGAGNITMCGNSAPVTCGYIAPPSTGSDPRGCSCPAPATYPGEPCKITKCALP